MTCFSMHILEIKNVQLWGTNRCIGVYREVKSVLEKDSNEKSGKIQANKKVIVPQKLWSMLTPALLEHYIFVSWYLEKTLAAPS